MKTSSVRLDLCLLGLLGLAGLSCGDDGPGGTVTPMNVDAAAPIDGSAGSDGSTSGTDGPAVDAPLPDGPRADASGGTDAAPMCAMMGPENTLAACSDGCSNDGDRFADCDDFDCCNVRNDCPATSACGRRDGGMSTVDARPAVDAASSPDANLCPMQGPENTLAACSDGCSNDGDRFVDCDDFDCCTVRNDCPATTACGRRDAAP